MDKKRLSAILNTVASGDMSTAGALDLLRHLHYEDLRYPYSQF